VVASVPFTLLNPIVGSALLAAVVTEGAVPFPRGEVVPDLAAAHDPAQTYALYAPRSVDPAKPAPILYLLDPRGRALVPIERFRAAADATGVVLASSYRSRSDVADDPNLPALQAMWADTHARLRIDDARVYVAGFSGTARAACYMADAAPGAIAGVIGAGAGFPYERRPRRDLPFLYFGAVGDTDFNYGEMQELERRFADLGLVYRLEVFPGGHDWMTGEVATAALRFLELRAVRDGRRPGDSDLVAAAFARDAERARTLEAAGRAFEAARQWSWIARDYEGLRDVDEARARAAALAAAARRDEGERVARERREERRVEQAQAVLARAVSGGDEPWPPARVVAQIDVERLRKRAPEDSEEGRSARRVLNAVFVQAAHYLPRDAHRRGEDGRAALYLFVAAAIRPEDPQVWYRLAAAESRSGHRRQAVEALGKAVEAGFADAERLGADPDFERLRPDPEFQAVAARVGR